MVDQALKLFIKVNNKNSDNFTKSCLGRLRAHTFLNNKSTLLKLLPPTENALFNPPKRAALSTAVDNSVHINKPQIPPYEEDGWVLNAGELVSVTSTAPAWPESSLLAAARRDVRRTAHA